ncbi:MAG: PEP-CTERM sorting domain-containing protein [Planctomycetaceae bacterium]|nr:PEP-CTERM sorting domain-containing protein [Planctomycetaceae bacterium]
MKHTVLTILALAAVLALAGAATADSYTAINSGDWSTAGTWNTTPPAGGPGAADHANLDVGVTYDAGASGALGSMGIGVGGSLAVADGQVFNVGGDGNNTIEVHNSNAFSIGATSQINYTGGQFHFRDGAVNTIDFANTATDGKMSVSTDLVLNIGDDGSATTLNIGAASSGTHFGSHGGGAASMLNIDSATIGFGNWDSGNRVSLTNGAVVNIDGYVAVYTPDAITLDNTSQLTVGGSLYVRTATLDVAGASITVAGNVFSDSGNYQLNVIQNAGQTTGMTLNGDLSLNTGDILNLVFDGTELAGPDWAFRWLGDHVSDLQNLQTAGKLTWSGAPLDVGFLYNVADNYTYVGYISNIPEPATMSLLALGGLAALIRRKRQ